MGLTKKELVEYVRIAEHNQEVAEEALNQQAENVKDWMPVMHGRWVWDIETHGNPMYCIDEDFGYRCSECKVWADEYGVDGDIYEEPPTHILHFCPNCGAKMDSEE
jgi:hypothetical protein